MSIENCGATDWKAIVEPEGSKPAASMIACENFEVRIPYVLQQG